MSFLNCIYNINLSILMKNKKRKFMTAGHSSLNQIKKQIQTFDLNNRTALISGSSTGLGKAIAMLYGEAGANVIFNYANNKDRALKTFDEFQEKGFKGRLIQADICNEIEVNALVKEIETDFGTIDILIPNATPDQKHKPIEDYTWDDYMEMINFFIKSPYLLTQAVLPKMKQQKYGRMIHIITEAYTKSVANFSAYVAAKGGQLGFARSLSTELAPWNITVNMISPGWIPVERHKDDCELEKENYLSGIPLNRWGTTEDVAAAALFFASDASAFVTGQHLNINGGNSLPGY
jgi:3-oxoacyl-[acyl-carrier protein] reductase